LAPHEDREAPANASRAARPTCPSWYRVSRAHRPSKWAYPTPSTSGFSSEGIKYEAAQPPTAAPSSAATQCYASTSQGQPCGDFRWKSAQHLSEDNEYDAEYFTREPVDGNGAQSLVQSRHFGGPSLSLTDQSESHVI
jgi:hypothetical protein